MTDADTARAVADHDPVGPGEGKGISVAEMRALIGTEVGVSRWFDVPQAMIDTFADATQDHQYIHVDPKRAAGTPFGGTIAHGFLTLSLLAPMAYDAMPRLAGTVLSINYGFDKVRFVSPVPAGARVRARFAVQSVTEPQPGTIALAWSVTMDIEGGAKPALIATWLNRRVLAAPTP